MMLVEDLIDLLLGRKARTASPARSLAKVVESSASWLQRRLERSCSLLVTMDELKLKLRRRRLERRELLDLEEELGLGRA